MFSARTLLLMLVSGCLAAALVAAPAGASAAPTAAAAKAKAKKKCKKGYAVKTVKRGGKRVRVCRKKASAKKPGAAKPSVAKVEDVLRSYFKELHTPTGGTADQVDVAFTKPTRVLGAVKYDPDGDQNVATGPIDAWPVRAWITITVRKSPTETETFFTGCDGDRDPNASWPYKSLFYFFQSAAGGLEWRSNVPGSVGC